MATETTCNTTGQSGTANSLPGSLGRDYRNKKNCDSDDEDISTRTHTLERAKSDHNLPTGKSEEDRRRRTIIIEKKNNSYGFTLQTYGIHYKKEQEIEMITYVDYVEYDGPAYKAGMREGDVILSINGIDMEKADHKTLVNHIKSCDNRMRMVVLFEDCVRKVSLHMRYIQLQNKLQDKIQELERACLQERQLLSGKWKTHSLPARKKASGGTPVDQPENTIVNGMGLMNLADGNSAMVYRPSISTEDVVNAGQARRIQQVQQQLIIPPPDQYIVAYQYIDPNYRYVLKPSTSNSSGEYFISVGPQRSPSECHYILTRDGSTEKVQQQRQQQQQHLQQQNLQQANKPCCEKENQRAHNEEERTARKSHCHGHSCNPCLGNFGRKSTDRNGEDNTSLDAYDLAGSPCCAAHCVPTRRRSHKSKEHHHHHHKHKHRDRDKDRQQRPKSQSHASPESNHHHHHHHHAQQQSQTHYNQQQTNLHQQQNRSKYFNLSANLASHCSLHSCTSSEFAPAESSASYTTSLSTDTLYWDPQSEGGNSRQPSTKSRQTIYQSAQNSQAGSIISNKSQQLVQKGFPSQTLFQQQQRFCMHPAQIQPIQQNAIYQTPVCVSKPKSWDNLTTKAFGGYGFGYGYLDTVGSKPQMKIQIENFTSDAAINGQQRHSIPRKNPYGRYSTYADVENYAPPPSQFVEELTTLTVFVKKTEQTVTEQTVPLVSGTLNKSINSKLNANNTNNKGSSNGK